MIYSLSISSYIFHPNIIYEIKAYLKNKNDSNVLSLTYWKNDEATDKNTLLETDLGRRKRDDKVYFQYVQFA